MLVFSQVMPLHSRIGNSFGWMARIASVLKRHPGFQGTEIAFPFAYETFADYLDPRSFWLTKSPNVDERFKRIYGIELNALNVTRVSRRIERDFEIRNKLSPFEWDQIIESSIESNSLYLSGKIAWNEETIALIQAHKLTLIHEPIGFSYDASDGGDEKDFSSLVPREDLFDAERMHVASLSRGKGTVGLHIRRKDYSRWLGGQYFYDDVFWENKAKEFLSANKAVWIFSDEVSSDLYARLEPLGVVISNGLFHQDFVRLMCMDEIFGPPSTFTALAVYIARTMMLRPTLNFLPAIQSQ